MSAPTEVAGLSLRVELPGAAGTHQRSGDIDALVAELGGRYATYHEFLAVELAKLPPWSRGHGREGEMTLERAARFQHVLMAEAVLRACRHHWRENRPLDDPLPAAVPFVDAWGRLASIDDPPRADDPGPPWDPPREPAHWRGSAT